MAESKKSSSIGQEAIELEAGIQISARMLKEIPKDLQRIKASKADPDKLKDLIASTVMSYVEDLAKILHTVLVSQDASRAYLGEVTDWIEGTTEHLDAIDDVVSAIGSDGGTIVSRVDYDIMMKVANGLQILASESIKTAHTQETRDSLSELIILAKRQISILEDASVTEEDELEEDAPYDFEDEDDDEELS